MLSARGRAPPFGDLAYGATAARADVGIDIELANLFARGWWMLRHEVVKSRAAGPTRSGSAAHG